MKSYAFMVTRVSETRFAHFTRTASTAERQSLVSRAMRSATEEQRKIIKNHEEKKKKLAAR